MNKRIFIFLLIFIVGLISGIVGYSNAKITTFEECENSWLVRSVTIYNQSNNIHGVVEKACKLWGGMTFVKLRDQYAENNLKTHYCNECKTSFSKSPVDFGPKIAMCGDFSTEYPISTNDRSFFQNTPMSVSACESYLDIQKVIKIATAHLSYPTTVIEVKELECDGCFSVILQRDDNQQQFTITLNDWKIVH